MHTLRNKVQLIGNLGQSPEVINFENGNKLAKIRIATNEVYRDEAGERQESVHWHNAIAWGKQAELLEKYVNKGEQIGIEGKLVTRSYETATKEKRTKTEVQISEVLFLSHHPKPKN